MTRQPTSNDRTVIQLLLPYAMHGAEGVYSSIHGEVVIGLAEQPKDLLPSYLLFDVEQEEPKQHVLLIPDNLGVRHRTVIKVRKKGLLPLEPPEGYSLETYEHRLLDMCENATTEIFDWYTYCTRNFGLPKISFRDIQSFQMWYELNDDPTPRDTVTRTLRTAKLSFVPELNLDGDMMLRQRMIRIHELSVGYQVAITLFTEAMRALHINNTRLACIQAVSSIEIALKNFVETSVKNNFVDQEQKRLSVKASQELRKDALTLFSLINTYFPGLLPGETLKPEELIATCDRLRKIRNAAIHSGTEPPRAEVESEILMVDTLINFLIELPLPLA